MKKNIIFLIPLSFILSPIHSFSQNKQQSFFKKNSNTQSTEKNFFKKKEIETIIESKILIDTSKSEVVSVSDTLIESDINKGIVFLDSPVEDGTVTSSYSPKRFHPVLKKWKAHKGTDFAAPYGTPIKATAGGFIEAASYSSGNGNFVKIKHNDTFSTQYLHMSKILVKYGNYIKKGDVIGLVGSTGLATGPHVCYRFWKNGVQVDPYEIADENEKIDNEKDIDNQDTKDFKKFISGFFKE